MTLINPAAIDTFSSGLNGYDMCLEKALNTPNSSDAACTVVAIYPPVWKPKYMLEMHSGIPGGVPHMMPRKVRLRDREV